MAWTGEALDWDRRAGVRCHCSAAPRAASAMAASQATDPEFISEGNKTSFLYWQARCWAGARQGGGSGSRPVDVVEARRPAEDPAH